MLWIKFRYPASQFFLPINTHPRKHSPVWQAAFNPCILHNWWNFFGDSLEAPLIVCLALLTVLGQLPGQLWVSQKKDEARTQLENWCAGTEVSGIPDHSATAGQTPMPRSSLSAWKSECGAESHRFWSLQNEGGSRSCLTWQKIFSDSQQHTYWILIY